MQALQFEKYGEKDVLKINKVDVPTIKNPKDVLITVRAASLNPIDYIIRLGYLQSMLKLNLPSGISFDVSGVVSEVGKDVSRFKKGDQVYSRVPQEYMGTVQEYIIVPEDALALKPSNLSFEEAASIPLASLTAYQCFVEKANLKKGDKVFISGGSGGVGSFAVQYAKHVVGAYVVTTTSEKNAQLLKDLGADEVIDYTKEDFTQKLKDFDIALDLTREGGKILNILRKGGKGYSANVSPNEEILKLATEKESSYEYLWMHPSGSDLEKLAKFYEKKLVKPVIDSVYDFKDFQKAFERLESKRSVGKVVIQISK